MKKINWYIATQKSGSLLTRYIIAKNTFLIYIGQICNYDLRLRNYKFIDKTNWLDRNETDEIYTKLKKHLLKDKSRRLIDECDKFGEDFVRFAKVQNAKKVVKLSNLELIEIFREWEKKYAIMWAFVNVGFLAIGAFSQEILNKLNNAGQNSDSIFAKLSFVGRQNYITKRQNEIISTAIHLYNNKNLRKLFQTKNSQEIKKNLPPWLFKKLQKLNDKYSWSGMIFLLGDSHKIEDLLEELKIMISQNPILKKKKIAEEFRNNLQEQKKIENELKSWSNLKNLFFELRRNAHKRTEEMRYLQLGEYYSRPLLEEIAGRLNINFEEVIFLTSDEVVEFLQGKGKPNRGLIKSRQKDYALVLIEGKLKVHSGAETKQLKPKFSAKRVSEIRGMAACGGIARGEAKIILDARDLYKLKKGNILVALMTTPDYVLAMKRSAAIVTDDGGITCHAAIISRELGIPCIIGAKVATKLLKDGDLVEVDATHGLIKVLKRKSSPGQGQD